MTGYEDILRRSFVAIASGNFTAVGAYGELDVQGEVKTLHEWLCDPALGERRFDSSRFESLAHQPSLEEIKSKVTGYVGDRLERPFNDADAVVLYVTGHGQTDKGAHYTVLKNSDPAHLSATAVLTVDLLRWLAGHQGLEQVLLVIDLCQAGDIADEVTAGLRRELPRGWIALLTTGPAPTRRSVRSPAQ